MQIIAERTLTGGTGWLPEVSLSFPLVVISFGQPSSCAGMLASVEDEFFAIGFCQQSFVCRYQVFPQTCRRVI
jgi:hypothetical protein